MKYIKSYEKQTIKPLIRYWKNGQKYSENYYLKDKRHRENGPAFQYWYENGQKQSEEYYLNGKCHRENGPAFQHWYDNNQKESEYYYLDGKLHRENGPARQNWYENGEKKSEEYYLNGEQYTREEWINQLKIINSPHYEIENTKYNAEKYNI